MDDLRPAIRGYLVYLAGREASRPNHSSRDFRERSLLMTTKMEDSMEVVILCGGQGTRSYPFTEYFPKVMMPVNGTPILVHLMRIYASQGFGDFILAGGHRREMLN